MPMSKSITIRTGNLSDLAEVQRLSQALFAFEKDNKLHANVYNQEWSIQPAGENYFAECLRGEKNQAVFIAELEGKTVGYIAASCRSYPPRSTNPMAVLENMFVDEAHRRHGVGTKLVEAYKAWGKSMGAAVFKVGALVPNAPAIAFYHKNGFKDFAISLEMDATSN
jgi:GNAT superfamily N-acetyltransferase